MLKSSTRMIQIVNNSLEPLVYAWRCLLHLDDQGGDTVAAVRGVQAADEVPDRWHVLGRHNDLLERLLFLPLELLDLLVLDNLLEYVARDGLVGAGALERVSGLAAAVDADALHGGDAVDGLVALPLFHLPLFHLVSIGDRQQAESGEKNEETELGEESHRNVLQGRKCFNNYVTS
jgi:hypothetical protein